MAHDFTGQTAVVTGGTRGIGAAVSRALLEAGAEVTAVYGGNTAAAEAFRAALPEALRARCSVARCDVADASAVAAFFAEFAKTHARLDVLFAGAGVRLDGVVAMLPEEQWRRVLEVNLDGAFHCVKQAVLQMLPNRYGRIVLLTSPMGRMGWVGQANYAASKAGLVGMAKSLAKEVARRGITVNCISPGFIDTDFIGSLTAEQRASYAAMVPMRRFGTPEEIAAAALYLASKEAGYTTGAVLEVSGGL